MRNLRATEPTRARTALTRSVDGADADTEALASAVPSASTTRWSVVVGRASVVAAPRNGKWCWRCCDPTEATLACHASSSRRCVVLRKPSSQLLCVGRLVLPLAARRAEPFTLPAVCFQESESHTIGRSSGCSTTVDAHFRATSRKHCFLSVSPKGTGVELHEESAQHGVYYRSCTDDHDSNDGLWTRKAKLRLKEGA